MAQKLVKFSGLVVPILLVCFCFPAAQAQGQMNDEKQAQTVTGCLQQGAETGGFTLTGEDGKMWELRSTKVQLAPHVGHTITVTGTATGPSKAQEEKIEASETKEANGKEHGDLRVASLKMVSDSCK